MRTELEKIGSEERHTFTGIFVRIGTKNGYKGVEETVLLQSIKDESGKVITDHLWFNRTKGFIEAAPKAGDVIQFDARVAEYLKGYFGHRDDVYNPPSWDYKLERPTKVKNLTHPDAKPKKKKKKKEKPAEPIPEPEKIEVKYTEYVEESATERQMDFITAIAKTLNIPVPKDLTCKAASEWISDHIDTFKQAESKQKHQEMMKKILPYLKKNATAKEACAELSISSSTYYKYKKEAKEKDLIE